MNLRLPPRLIALLGAFIVFGVPSARAANPSVKECLAASETSLKLANDYKLRAERAQLLICSSASCPSEVRKECLRRVEDVNQAIPSIVFDVKAPDGTDLTAVKITMDDEVVAERLRGVALTVDPGEHKFRFETAGQPPLEKQFLIRESQKDRHELVQFPGPKPESATTAPDKPSKPQAAGEHGASESPESGRNAKEFAQSSTTTADVRNLLTLAIQQDYLYHTTPTNVCAPSSLYECYQGNGERVLVEDSDTIRTQVLGSGFGSGNLRLLAGFDHFVLAQLSLGARIGAVISGKPKQSPGDAPFFFLHAEARIAYWLTRKPLVSSFSPYLVASGGAAEADIQVQLRYQDTSLGCSDCRLNGWRRAGFEFVSAGIGVVAAVAGSTGPLLEARYVQYLGKSGSAIAGQLGYAVGF